MDERLSGQAWWRAWGERRTWRLVAYDLVSLPVGIAGCVVTAFGLLYGVALAALGVGLVALLVVVAAARAGARMERRRARRSLGIEVREPATHRKPAAGRFRAVLARLRDRRTRREVGYFLLAGPVGVASALVAAGTLYLIGRALAEVLLVALAPASLHGDWGGSVAGVLVVHCAPGVLALLLGPAAIGKTAYAQGRLIRHLLGP